MKWFKLILFGFLLSCTNTIRPTHLEDFRHTSVKIVNETESLGGSGVILESHEDYSIILTNGHVCNLFKESKIGWVILSENPNVKFKIKTFKIFKEHDLCLIHVPIDLEINTKISKQAPKEYDYLVVSGHPYLYPHMISQGYLVANIELEFTVGTRLCDPIEAVQQPLPCAIYGFPVKKKYDTQLTTALIAKGSSGSGVFNKYGELIGLVFANVGYGDGIGYGVIVPWKYLESFVKEDPEINPWIIFE